MSRIKFCKITTIKVDSSDTKTELFSFVRSNTNTLIKFCF